MDYTKFMEMTQKHPWLLELLMKKTGTSKMPSSTKIRTDKLVADATEKIVEAPYDTLVVDEEARLTSTFGHTRVWSSVHYTIVWQKNAGGQYLYTGKSESHGYSAKTLLGHIHEQCQNDGDTAHVIAVVRTMQTFDLQIGHKAKYSFTLYPYEQ